MSKNFFRLHGLVGSMSKSKELELLRKIAYMELDVVLSERAKYAKGLVYDKFDGLNEHSRAKIDMTKTFAKTAIEAGATSVEVDSTEGFKVGQEVTVYDNENIERPTISNIRSEGQDIIDFTEPLTKSFKEQAGIARTNAEIKDGELVFGTWVGEGFVIKEVK